MEKRSHKKRIGLLGGTFNPPHLGHLYLAKAMYDEFSLDKVVFIPLGDPPHKTGERIASATDRINMLRIMTEEYPYMSVSSIETEREGLTYTVDTLKELNERMGTECDFFYIIGSDTLFQLENWKSCGEVFKLTSFLCVPRPGNSLSDIRRESASLKERYGAEIYLSAHTGPDISSTDIRSAGGKNLLKTGINDKVLEYMEKNHVFDK